MGVMLNSVALNDVSRELWFDGHDAFSVEAPASAVRIVGMSVGVATISVAVDIDPVRLAVVRANVDGAVFVADSHARRAAVASGYLPLVVSSEGYARRAVAPAASVTAETALAPADFIRIVGMQATSDVAVEGHTGSRVIHARLVPADAVAVASVDASARFAVIRRPKMRRLRFSTLLFGDEGQITVLHVRQMYMRGQAFCRVTTRAVPNTILAYSYPKFGIQASVDIHGFSAHRGLAFSRAAFEITSAAVISRINDTEASGEFGVEASISPSIVKLGVRTAYVQSKVSIDVAMPPTDAVRQVLPLGVLRPQYHEWDARFSSVRAFAASVTSSAAAFSGGYQAYRTRPTFGRAEFGVTPHARPAGLRRVSSSVDVSTGQTALPTHHQAKRFAAAVEASFAGNAFARVITYMTAVGDLRVEPQAFLRLHAHVWALVVAESDSSIAADAYSLRFVGGRARFFADALGQYRRASRMASAAELRVTPRAGFRALHPVPVGAVATGVSATTSGFFQINYDGPSPPERTITLGGDSREYFVAAEPRELIV